ncbi:hypothetical protein GCM10009839_15780 [Catenulispora yoronensis]|uniref:Uncharacterized protein n=1 Tax=Catenulispora yoronensis TaxID=450799 RepID=A0ABN2TUC3_9ACTN
MPGTAKPCGPPPAVAGVAGVAADVVGGAAGGVEVLLEQAARAKAATAHAVVAARGRPARRERRGAAGTWGSGLGTGMGIQ